MRLAEAVNELAKRLRAIIAGISALGTREAAVKLLKVDRSTGNAFTREHPIFWEWFQTVGANGVTAETLGSFQSWLESKPFDTQTLKVQFAFLSGHILGEKIASDIAIKSAAWEANEFDLDSPLQTGYSNFLQDPVIPETITPIRKDPKLLGQDDRRMPPSVDEPIPPVQGGDGAQVLPPEGPADRIPEPFIAPAPVDPNKSGQAGGGAIETVPPSDGAAPDPALGKSAGFVTYMKKQIDNDFFKQSGWEITHGARGEDVLPGTTLGDYLDQNPDLHESYFTELARQAKNWDTFRVNQAVLFGQTEGEELRTLEDDIKKVRKALSNFGVNLDEVDEATIIGIARNAFIMGWDEQEIDQALYDNAELAITNMAKGDHANWVSQLRDKAQLYMLNIDDATLDHYAQQINTGMATLGGITQGFAEMARSEYPALKEIMDKGFLPGTYFGSFQTAATNLLERPVKFFGDDRNMFDVIAKGVPDEETGFRPMTIPEAQTYIRSLPEWENTKNARQRGRSVVENIMNKWGAVSSNYGIKAPQRSSY